MTSEELGQLVCSAIEANHRWRKLQNARLAGLGGHLVEDLEYAWRHAEADLDRHLGPRRCHRCGMPRENVSALLCAACAAADADAEAAVAVER